MTVRKDFITRPESSSSSRGGRRRTRTGGDVGKSKMIVAMEMTILQLAIAARRAKVVRMLLEKAWRLARRRPLLYWSRSENPCFLHQREHREAGRDAVLPRPPQSSGLPLQLSQVRKHPAGGNRSPPGRKIPHQVAQVRTQTLYVVSFSRSGPTLRTFQPEYS